MALQEKVAGMAKSHNQEHPDVFNKPNERFKSYKNVFENLLMTRNCDCEDPVVNAIILNDATTIVTVCKQSNKCFKVKMFGVDDGIQCFEESFTGNYVKMKEVEQNSSGNKFVVTYFDDGVFKLRSFGKEERTEDQIKASEVNLNDMLGIDAWTMAVMNFPDPFITCCFVDDDLIFVNLYHNYLMKHFHFYYNIETNKLVG